MIKFFRKIRQSLLFENKFSKYLIYAIGEIILVVIGILIALQINNLNEDRKNRIAEIQMLTNISNELISNDDILNNSDNIISNQINQTKDFLNLMHSQPQDSSISKVGKLLSQATEVEDVQLSLSAINRTIDNSIELIRNDSIKNNLLKYPLLFAGYKEQEKLMMSLKDDRIRPRIKEHIYIGDKSKFPSDFINLLSDRNLANDLTDRLWESNEWKDDLLTVKNQGQLLIRLIEKEIN